VALDYFRRSFRASGKPEDGIVNLAIAFETLLTDGYAKGVGDRVKRRVHLLLKGVSGVRKMGAAVKELSELRNKSVHTGSAPKEPDWRLCRTAFIYSFLGLSQRFDRLKWLNTSTGSPVGDIIGD
jgi:hypothetical protein